MSTAARDAPHFLHVFATFTAAGPQVRTARLIQALGDSHRHTIVPMDGRDDARRLIGAGVQVDVLAPPRARPAVGGLARLLRELAPDALLTYNWGSFDALLAACSRPRLPVLHHEDGFNADEARGQKQRRVLARRLVLRRARSVIVPSRVLERIARESWRVAAGRLLLIPNGIDTSGFTPADPAGRERAQALRESLGIAAHDFVVGAVGHLRPVKRFDRLIEACSRVDRAALGTRGLHLLIVGDGEERQRLAALAERAPPPGGRVHFVGHQQELPPWYHALDAFALSSDSEQHPVALIEAMSCGLPVAATDVGDVRQVLPAQQHEALATADEAGAQLLAAALSRLASDQRLRARLADVNRQRVLERYAFDAMLAAYRRAYANLLPDRAVLRAGKGP
jgi:glycosyltransferase involved in cell wall biosynthesis